MAETQMFSRAWWSISCLVRTSSVIKWVEQEVVVTTMPVRRSPEHPRSGPPEVVQPIGVNTNRIHTVILRATNWPWTTRTLVQAKPVGSTSVLKRDRLRTCPRTPILGEEFPTISIVPPNGMTLCLHRCRWDKVRGDLGWNCSMGGFQGWQ